jgi:hypothetical protein
MNIIGVGRTFWKTCHQILDYGSQPNQLKYNKNASKAEMVANLNSFFEQMKELSEPIATVLVRQATTEHTTIKLKN